MMTSRPDSFGVTAPVRALVAGTQSALRRSGDAAVLVALLLILAGGFAVRAAQHRHFSENPHFAPLLAYYLATARATTEGRPFHYVPSDLEAARDFLGDRDSAFTSSLSVYDREAERRREPGRDPDYVPNFSDLAGWGFFIVLVRLLPGVDSLAGVAMVQILLDLGALLLLYPIGVFVTGRRVIALAGAALYAFHLPAAFAAAEPFRDAWPGFAVIYGTALMLPVWKRGPSGVLRSAGWLAAAGIVVAFFAAGRTTAVTTPVTLAAITWIAWRRFGPAAVAGATVTAAMLLALTPWMATTYRNAGVVTVASSGGGHSLLTGLGEEADNPLGIQFDDRFTRIYIQDVCGYDVEYASFPYSAACKREADRFIAEHRPWYLGLVGRRILTSYLYRVDAPRLNWGLGLSLPWNLRRTAERWLPPLGIAGALAGLLVFPRAWIPLLWVIHFWVFIFPIQSHPRLLLGGDWALCLGAAMLPGALLLVLRRLLGRPGPERTPVETAAPKGVPSLPPAGDGGGSRGRLRWLATFVFGINLVAGVLMVLHAPVAPRERNDWRAGLASPDPEVRIATLEAVRPWGADALPVLEQAFTSEDPAVRGRASSILRSFRNTYAKVDFAGGSSDGLPIREGTRLEVLSGSDAMNGYYGRLSAPREPFKPFFRLVWSDTTASRGVDRIAFRFRSNTPLTLGLFAQGQLRMRSDVPGDYPMSGFEETTLSFRNPRPGDTLMMELQQAGSAAQGTGDVIVELDWIEITKETASPAP